MKYMIKSDFETGEIAVTSEDFDSIRQAGICNQNMLALEEKYFLILKNYVDFERALHELALTGMVFGRKKWTGYMDDLHVVNGELLNFLSSTKAYLDQVPQHLNNMYGPDCAQSKEFNGATHCEFDTSFGYRVMSAVRNHVQHNDFPVKWLEVGGRWEMDEEERVVCRHHATGEISVADLVGNLNIRDATRAELAATGETVLNVKLYVRQYVSSMGRLHETLRVRLKADAEKSELTIRAALLTAAKVFAKEYSTFHILAIDGNGNTTEHIPMFVENIERTKHLINYCPIITNVENHCVSSEI